MKKKLGVFLILVTVVLSSLGSGVSLAREGLKQESSLQKDISTPKDYMNYLTERGKKEPWILKVKEQFSNFSPKKQEKFISYITDPDVIKKMSEAMALDKEITELCNGDIVITSRHTVTEVDSTEEKEPRKITDIISSFFVREVAAADFFKEYKVTHYKEAKVLGLHISSVNNWVLYKSKNNKEVIKIISGGSYIQSAGPWWVIEKLTEERYIYRNKAHNCVKYKYAPFVTPWTSVKVLHHDVLGHPNGSSSYRLWHS